MKRSNLPVLWSLFGAGGMLSALVGPMLVFITGIAVPFGIWLSPQTMSYERMQAFAHSPWGAITIAAVIGLFLFHGLHRIYHGLHDFGVHVGPGLRALIHGLALAGTVATVVLLVLI